MRHRRNEHYITLRHRYVHETQSYRPEWSCVSTWDMPDGPRLRREMYRVTYYSNVKDAQRWARKYDVECPTLDVQGCEPSHTKSVIIKD